MELRKITSVILIVITLSHVTSCIQNQCGGKNPLQEIDEETKGWLPFKQGDKLIFRNGTLTDTVIVASYVEERESFERGDECSDGKMETIKVTLTSPLFDNSIRFKIEHKDKVIVENEELMLEFNEDNGEIVHAYVSGVYHPTLKIGDQTYAHVLVATCDTCYNLTEISFSKNIGLIAFETQLGYWVKD